MHTFLQHHSVLFLFFFRNLSGFRFSSASRFVVADVHSASSNTANGTFDSGNAKNSGSPMTLTLVSRQQSSAVPDKVSLHDLLWSLDANNFYPYVWRGLVSDSTIQVRNAMMFLLQTHFTIHIPACTKTRICAFKGITLKKNQYNFCK